MNNGTKEHEDGQLTIWSPASEVLKTQYGRLTYHDWCVRECARMGNDQWTVKLNAKGECCVTKRV